MKTIRLEIELEYNDEAYHADCPEALEWFRGEILLGNEGRLILYSSAAGDEVGVVKVTKILDDN